MKERPILFSGAMVRDILAERKTQTRRVVKPQPIHRPILSDNGNWYDADCINPGVPMKCPYGQIGTILYVKEATWIWCEKRKDGVTNTGRPKHRYVPVGQHAAYCADEAKPVKPLDSDSTHLWRYKTGRFMPRWASRITLELTGIRVERVQAISESDAIAEGIEKGPANYFDCGVLGRNGYPNCLLHNTAASAYAHLWDWINASTYPWISNPWVWVLEFRRVEK